MKLETVGLKNIEQNENSRVVYKDVDLAELISSMRRDGLLQPVGVRELSKGKYEAIWGNRRILAAKKLDWKDIPAVVMELDSDNERDFLNLAENINRQNLSLPEEGRLYDVLKERGLKPDEIAARLGISKQRVETALDSFKFVPADMKKNVVNRVSGRKKAGTVSATAYVAIKNARNNFKLNRGQFRTLLKFASDEHVNTNQIQQIAPLVSEGLEIREAMEKVEKYDRLPLTVWIPKIRRAKLEKASGRTIHEIIYEFLEQNEEFGLRRRLSGNSTNSTLYDSRLSTLRKKFRVSNKKKAERAEAWEEEMAQEAAE